MAEPIPADVFSQAMIGIAFSLGFTLGPLMGAYFAVHAGQGELFHQYPALLAMVFSLADLLFIWLLLPETLAKHLKVSPRDWPRTLWHVSTAGYGSVWYGSRFHCEKVGMTRTEPYSLGVLLCWGTETLKGYRQFPSYTRCPLIGQQNRHFRAPGG